MPIYYPGDFTFMGDVQLETTLANTHHRSFGFDSARLTFRYQFMDDITDDPFSVMVGATAIQAVRLALNDCGSFHHGLIEGEAHVTIGKESSYKQLWLHHWWLTLGVGGADVGYPWVRANAVWEKNFCNEHHLRVFVNTLWGMGHHNLHRNHHFHGYGNIRHQSVDVGIRYGYWFPFDGELSAEYARRVYAKNFPANGNIFQLAYLYPFGL